MRYLAGAAARKQGNPWAALLAYLKEAEDPTPAPRKLSEWQMYTLKKRDIINTIFDAEWPLSGRPSKDDLAFRAEIAKRLLAAEPDAYRHDLRQEIEDSHARDLQAYAAQLQLCPRTSDETQQKYVVFFLAEIISLNLLAARETTSHQLWSHFSTSSVNIRVTTSSF